MQYTTKTLKKVEKLNYSKGESKKLGSNLKLIQYEIIKYNTSRAI